METNDRGLVAMAHAPRSVRQGSSRVSSSRDTLRRGETTGTRKGTQLMMA